MIVPKSGETIELQPGTHDQLKISRVQDVHIRGGPETVFNYLYIEGAKNVTLESFAIRGVQTPTSTDNSQLCRIVTSQGLTLSKLNIRGSKSTTGIDASSPVGTSNPGSLVKGLPFGKGVYLYQSADVKLLDCDISEVSNGVSVASLDGFEFSDNNIHHLRRTPINGGDVHNGKIRRNHLYHSTPWALGGTGDHGDQIHFWTTDKTCRNLEIADNFMDRDGMSALLGIYLDDNGKGFGFENIRILSNLLSNSDGQGLTLEHVVNAIIMDNVFLWDGWGTLKQEPRIDIKAKSRNIELVGNRCKQITHSMSTPDEIATFRMVENRLGSTVASELEVAVKAWKSRFRPDPVTQPTEVEILRAKLAEIKAIIDR